MKTTVVLCALLFCTTATAQEDYLVYRALRGIEWELFALRMELSYQMEPPPAVPQYYYHYTSGSGDLRAKRAAANRAKLAAKREARREILRAEALERKR